MPFKIIILLLVISPLYGHQTNMISYSHIEIIDTSVLFLNLPNSQTHLFYAGYPEMRQEVKDTIIVSNNNELCPLTRFLTHSDNNLSQDPYFFIAQCEHTITQLRIQDRFPLDNNPTLIYNVSHKDTTLTFNGNSPLDFSTTITPAGLLSEEDSAQDKNLNQKTTSQSQSTGKLFWSYILFGLEHILLGVDHIFFILGFILLAHTFSGLLKGITGFTISHSITLTLAAQSIITLAPQIVEPLIAMSIAVVGILAILDIVKNWLTRFGIIFGFGLFHGLGFAGSIAEVGFPQEGFFASLLGFNIGIELGQLLIVFLIWPILAYIKINHTKMHTVVTLALSYIVTTGGLFWSVQRLFFS